MTYEECFFCGKTTQNSLKNIKFLSLSTKVPGSQREVRFVLEHLANCIRTKLSFENGSSICSVCFKEIGDYDKLMVKLLASQKKLTSRLQEILSTKWKDNEEELGNDESNAEEAIFEVDSKMELEESVEIEVEPKTEPIDVDEDEQPIAEEDVIAKAADADDEEEFLAEASECVTCGEKFLSKMLLHKHINETHSIQVFKCKICGVTRKDEEYLELHMNTHEGKTELECRYCPKRFSRPTHTVRHMRKHWDKKAYQCEKCGERFSLDNMLYNHRLQHEAEENPLICSICNQIFKSRKTYNHHQVTHQKHRPRHQCPLCTKSFTERYTLKMHMNIHNENKETEESAIEETVTANAPEKHACVVCGKKFQTADILNVHLKDNHDVILQ